MKQSINAVRMRRNGPPDKTVGREQIVNSQSGSRGEDCRLFPASITGMGHGLAIWFAKLVQAGGAGMSGSGLRTLSFVLLVAMVAYVAWSGGL
jgi:hypothetical protein